MKDFYRKATSKELQLYQQKIYPLQDTIFEIISGYGDRLYLTGDTALSRFYFKHRLSEDLDFFIITDDLRLLVNDLSSLLNNNGFLIEIEQLEPYFARIYIVEDNFRLKVDFSREFNLYGSLIKTDKGIFINNLEDLGANKITAFEDRAEIKDIIDLHYITQKIPLEKLFELADIKRVPIFYENLLAVNSIGLVGNALTSIDLEEQELINFADNLKLKTEEEIKKKEKAALDNIQQIINKLLWDFPYERRQINRLSVPVLKKRVIRLKLPEKMALQKLLSQNIG